MVVGLISTSKERIRSKSNKDVFFIQEGRIERFKLSEKNN